MSENGWTPGPWGIGDGYEVYAIEAYRAVAMVCGHREGSANANLIAASPALAEALERALPLLRLLTVRQVIQTGDEAINAAGLNPWAINEGLATGGEPISIWWAEAALSLAKNGST